MSSSHKSCTLPHSCFCRSVALVPRQRLAKLEAQTGPAVSAREVAPGMHLLPKNGHRRECNLLGSLDDRGKRHLRTLRRHLRTLRHTRVPNQPWSAHPDGRARAPPFQAHFGMGASTRNRQRARTTNSTTCIFGITARITACIVAITERPVVSSIELTLLVALHLKKRRRRHLYYRINIS